MYADMYAVIIQQIKFMITIEFCIGLLRFEFPILTLSNHL